MLQRKKAFKPFLANLLTLACCLWPRTQLYHSNAETENRLAKSAAVRYWQWPQRQSSQRLHIWRRSDCLGFLALFFHLQCTKLFGNVVSSFCCQLWTPCWWLIYRPGVTRLVKLMIAQILAEEILADCSQNCQSAKINSPPKFPAIR